MKILFKLLLLLALLDLCYIAFLWFQSGVQVEGPIPLSRFMQAYQDERANNPDLPAMKWDPVPLAQIPDRVIRAVLIAEDTRFFVHRGLDFNAIREVISKGLENRSISRGASTITQQTAKNLFLYPARSWLRKWHEMIFTLILESTMTKDRILELYLNIAEFGNGVYGVNAASQYYFAEPVYGISLKQACSLAAALPWPKRHNYKTGTKSFNAHARRVYVRAQKEYIPLE